MSSETTPTLIMIGETERQIIEAYKVANGLPQRNGTSAAVRQIIRDWAKRNNRKLNEVKAA